VTSLYPIHSLARVEIPDQRHASSFLSSEGLQLGNRDSLHMITELVFTAKAVTVGNQSGVYVIGFCDDDACPVEYLLLQERTPESNQQGEQLNRETYYF